MAAISTVGCGGVGVGGGEGGGGGTASGVGIGVGIGGTSLKGCGVGGFGIGGCGVLGGGGGGGGGVGGMVINAVFCSGGSSMGCICSQMSTPATARIMSASRITAATMV